MNRSELGLLVSAALTAAGLCSTTPGFAADTVETWAVGATDVDFYIGYDGLGSARQDRAIYGDMMLGYGIVDRFSAYIGTTLQGESAFTEGNATHYLGVYGTPLETEHVDVDLFLDFSEGGPDRKFQIRPALELNLDDAQDMSTWGLYLRAPLPIYGRKVASPLHPDNESSEVTFDLESTVGGYMTLAPGHQFLLEYDMGYHPNPGQDERRVDVGGVALGYNVALADGLELINQVSADIPQDEERWSFGVMTGFIATLPAGTRTSGRDDARSR